ncbi:MAG: hypothetical protein AAFY02_12110 [Pseudomonadota bacterium]
MLRSLDEPKGDSTSAAIERLIPALQAKGIELAVVTNDLLFTAMQEVGHAAHP